MEKKGLVLYCELTVRDGLPHQAARLQGNSEEGVKPNHEGSTRELLRYKAHTFGVSSVWWMLSSELSGRIYGVGFPWGRLWL